MDKEDLRELEKKLNSTVTKAVAKVMVHVHKLHQEDMHQEDMKVFDEQWRWDSLDSFKMRQKCKPRD